jgi:hypothetical protein
MCGVVGNKIHFKIFKNPKGVSVINCIPCNKAKNRFSMHKHIANNRESWNAYQRKRYADDRENKHKYHNAYQKRVRDKRRKEKLLDSYSYDI